MVSCIARRCICSDDTAQTNTIQRSCNKSTHWAPVHAAAKFASIPGMQILQLGALGIITYAAEVWLESGTFRALGKILNLFWTGELDAWSLAS